VGVFRILQQIAGLLSVVKYDYSYGETKLYSVETMYIYVIGGWGQTECSSQSIKN